MTRIILNGALGKMGRMVTEMAAAEQTLEIVAGVDRFAAGASLSFPLFESLKDGLPEADVIIDFSLPGALPDILSYCHKHRLAAVLATTGYHEEDVAAIREASKTLRIFRSANMSLGINLLMTLSREAASALKGFDIEIVEAHHNTKVDAPSGTALMLAENINRELMDEREFVFGRHTKTERRKPQEIGIHAIRGGTVSGDHSIMFFGQDERVTLAHSAQSRRSYALGSLRAAEFVVRHENGLYNMQDLLTEQYPVTSLLIDKEQAMLTLREVPSSAGSIARIFSRLADEGILVDMISQTAPLQDTQNISFTFPDVELARAQSVLADLSPQNFGPVVKITIEGEGMERQSGVAAKVFKHLAAEDVRILMITTSETKISLLIDEQNEGKAIRSLRAAFKLAH